MAPEGAGNPQQWAELAIPMRGPAGTVTQRKGPPGEISGGYFTKPQEGGPKTYEYGRTL